MAFAPEQEEELKEDTMGVIAGPGATTGTALGASGPGAAVNGQQGIPIAGEAAFTGAGADIAQTPDEAPTGADAASGQFQNISQYLDANRAAAERLGERVGERFKQRTENIQQSLAGHRAGVLGQEGTLTKEKERVGAGQDFIGQQIAQAQQGQKASEEALKRYTQFRTGYDPRIETPSYVKEQQRIKDIQAQAKALATRKGKFGELQDITRGASRGEQSLDRALLAMARPEALRPESLRAVAATASEDLSGLQSDVASTRAANLAQRQALERMAAERLTGEEGALTQFRSGIESRIASERERITDQDKALREALGRSADLRPEDFARMGVSPEQQKEFASLYEKSRARTLEQKIKEGPGIEQGELTDEDLRIMGFTPDQYAYGREQFADQAYRDKLLAAIQEQGDLGQQALAQRTGAQVYGGLQDYIRQPGPQDITAATVSTPEQFAQSQALAQLAGVDPRLLQANIERAGISGQYGGQLDAGSALAGLQSRFPTHVTPEGFSYVPAQYTPQQQQQVDPYSGLGSTVGGILGDIISPGWGGKIGGSIVGGVLDPVVTQALGLGEKVLNLGQDKGIGSAIYRPVVTAAAKVVRSVSRAISSIFCFVAGTKVKMKDGSYKKIEDLKPKEEIFLGGKIIAAGAAIANDDIYDYRGTLVTGTHTVFEDGKWLNIKDTKSAIKTDLPKDTIVYPLVTDEHVMVTNDFISADLNEIDEESYSESKTMEEILEILNDDTGRNEWLSEEETKLKEMSDGNKKLSA